MKILVLNRGSSSIKCSLYNFTTLPEFPEKPIWEAHANWRNPSSASLQIKTQQSEDTQKIDDPSGKNVLEQILDALCKGKLAVLSSFEEVDVIGHRIVHGGKKYQETVLIDDEVKKHIQALSDLAPLHNLEDLEGIEVIEKFFKKKQQIAVFDTSFHRTLPKSAAYYPIPYHYIEEGIQRYGFHGINYQYCTRRIAQLLKQDINPLKIIICHLGSGASLCAVKDGKSIDTTMGFTPLEGLMMDTRSGTIDPGMILYLLKKKKLDEITQELYYKSGLLGISGISSDMRDIVEKASSNNSQCQLALEIYLHRLCSCIGSMIASLQGLDVLVFTAGIGENSPEIRKKVCEHFSFLGIKLDEKKNSQELKQDCELSTSKIKVLVIQAGETFEIARECMKKLA